MQCEMDNKQVIVGHIEKQEEPEIKEVTPETHAKQEKVMEPMQAEKVADQDDTTTMEEDNPTGVPRKRKTQLVTALKKMLAEAKIKEQQRWWDEATKWRCATEAALGDVDLETEMEQAEDVETTMTATEGMATVVTMTAASSSTQVVTAEVYAKPYMKTTESRGVRSTARSEKKEISPELHNNGVKEQFSKISPNKTEK